MKNKSFVMAALAASFSAGLILAAGRPAHAKTDAELEKEKAMQNPYPNDFGPESLEADVLKSYPAEHQEGYKLMLLRCSQCHTAARPLNSTFVEPDAGAGKVKSDEEREAKEAPVLAKLKGEHPECFKEPTVWKIEPNIWHRYVTRMLGKPGCGVSVGGKMTKEEAGKIYRFLVYDGQRRKLGEGADKWKAHRLKLIEALKAKDSKRFEELKSTNAL